MKYKIGLVFLLSFSILIAQDRKELETRRKDINKQIKVAEGLLQETNQTKQATMSRLVTLGAQLEQRQELVKVVQQELELIDENITRTESITQAMAVDLSQLKKDYAMMIQHAFRYKDSKNTWLYVFSSLELSEAYNRWRYLKRYNEYKRKQLTLISSTKNSLERKIKELEERRVEKEQLFMEHATQKQIIEREAKDKEKIVNSLKKEESRLQVEVQELQNDKNRLNTAIEEAIRTEMAKARERQRSYEESVAAKKEKGTSTAKKTTKTYSDEDIPLTPAETIVSDNFGGNMGKLGYPVESGVIVGKFGTHPHPVLPKVQVTNNGVDIQTKQGASIKAVFEGKVSYIMYTPAFKYAVLIQHGNYFTMYSNLESVSVDKEQQVSTGQSIGIAHTTDDGKTSVHFEIWKGKNKQNPERWLKR